MTIDISKEERKKAIASVVTVLFVVAICAKEVLWRIDHPLAQAAVPSPNGFKVAEVRFMPEGSVVPYGSGVVLRSRWIPLNSFQAELAFAGYCGTITARWPADQRLSIHCELVEGEPRVLSPVINGASVEITVQRKQAAKPSVERTRNGKALLAAHVKQIALRSPHA